MIGRMILPIRHHLRQLISEGLVRRTEEQVIEGRGRPTPLYTLVHPRSNLGGLVHHLLSLPGRETLLQIAAEKFSPASGDIRRHITQRLYHAMGRLEELHYQPRWEALPDGPEVILGHCPFSEVIAAHPELCTMDTHILERLLGTRVEQIEKLERNAEGMLLCRFRIQ